MKIEKRDVVKCVILSIVTCGIYGIIWAVKLARDAVNVKDENDPATIETVLMILFPFVGFYLCEKKFSEGCAAKGIAHSDNSILYLVLGLVGLGFVDFCLMQSELNKLVDAGYAVNPNGQPNPQYGAPQYGAPQYGAPQNPQYGASQNPQYGAPQNPQYGEPQNPQYGEPPYGNDQQN